MRNKTIKTANVSNTSYFQAMNYSLLYAMTAKSALNLVPSFIYPNNPAQTTFFPALNPQLLLRLCVVISPIFLVGNIINLFDSIKDFYYAENKNIYVYSNLFLNILTTAGNLAFYLLATSAIAYAALHVAPFVLMAVAGLNAVYSLFNVVKNLYFAWNNKNPEEKKAYYWAAFNNFLALVIHGLFLGVTYLIGLKIDANYLQLKMTDNIFAALAIMFKIGTIFKSSVTWLYALCGTVIAGVSLNVFASVRSFYDKFYGHNSQFTLKSSLSEKWNYLIRATKNYHPISRAVCIAATILISAVKVLYKLPSYLLSSILASIVHAGVLIKNKLHKESTVSKFDQKHESLHRDILKQELPAKLLAKQEQLSMQKPTPKRQAKQALVSDMLNSLKNDSAQPQQNKVDSAEMLKSAKKTSSSVFCSFWKETGDVERLFQQYQRYEQLEKSLASTVPSAA